MKKVYVLVLNYESASATIECVENILQQQGVDLHLLVVDNDSPDGSFTQLSERFHPHERVQVVKSERNGGYAYGNNTGLRLLTKVDYDFLIISNNDIHITDFHLLQKLADRYDRLGHPAFIAPAMYVDGQEDQKHQAWRLPTFRDEVMASVRTLYFIGKFFLPTSRYHFSAEETGAQSGGCLSGSFFMGSKARFDQVGLLDENTFLYGEETILGHKVKQLGLQNYLCRDLHYHHEQGSTTKRFNSLLQLQRYWLSSTLYYQRQYRQTAKWKLAILKILYFCWVLETLLFQVFPKRSQIHD